MLRKRSFGNPFECPRSREERSMSAPGNLLMDVWPFRHSLKLHPSLRKGRSGEGSREGELEDLDEDEPSSPVTQPSLAPHRRLSHLLPFKNYMPFPFKPPSVHCLSPPIK
nr:calcium/calmodulin-dependent protein kinase kinase 2-like [Oncorhynchus nerka]